MVNLLSNPNAQRHNFLDFIGLHDKVQLSVVRIHVKPNTVEMQDSSEREVSSKYSTHTASLLMCNGEYFDFIQDMFLVSLTKVP